MTTSLADLKHQLKALRALHDEGALSAEAYEVHRQKLEQALIERVMHETTEPVAASTPSAASTPLATSNPLPPSTPPRTWMVPAMVTGVVVLALAGYAWKGSPALLTRDGANPPTAAAPSGSASAESGAAGQHSTDAAQIQAMVDKLRQRLAAEPNNGEGWAMLGRSYNVLGQLPEAVQAYQKALALVPNDAALMADMADALAVQQGKSLKGEPEQWVQRALKIDPDQPKALALAGTIAFDRKDFAGAVKHWERVLKANPDHPFAASLRDSIAEARQLGGMPPLASSGARGDSGSASNAKANAPAPAPVPVPTNANANANANAARISGTVTVSKELASKAQADDTVFVFARPAEGSRMPLAIVRKQVRDLPLAYTLDDSLAMSPDAKLSSAKRVVVAARISRGGDAVPQPGDFVGQSAPVDVGGLDGKPLGRVDITINEVVPTKRP